MTQAAPLSFEATARRLQPNLWDLVAIPLVLGVIVLFAWGARQMAVPFTLGDTATITLDPRALPSYALRTTLRMLLALAASTVFSLGYAALAAKSRRAELILIPILDVLQSVPVLGYISFTVTAFIALFPGRLLGAEMAAIFAIFTAQAWNMTFSLYQSLRTTPRDLVEAAAVFQLSAWQKFWRLEVPFAMPGLVWNAMMSMSGSWFLLVASEAIAVGDKRISLPGIGSYIALAIERRSLPAVGYAVLTMLIVILAYDQLLFRPLVVWADKFKFETSASQLAPRSWLFDVFRRTRLFQAVARPMARVLQAFQALSVGRPRRAGPFGRAAASPAIDWLWYAIIAAAALGAASQIVAFVDSEVGWAEVGRGFVLGCYTGVRVVLMIAVASVVWVPLGALIGLRPALAERVQPVAQFLAAFPANLLFPVFVLAIVGWRLNANIWLSPLMILGTQWYILFNVIAGASAFPTDLSEAATSFRVRRWLWWRKVILPGIFPYFLTGAITASGGAWNASIVAEAVSWGDEHVRADGLGAYITDATAQGDFPRVALGIAIMSLYVTLMNRTIWRPLYRVAERRLRID